MSEKTSFTKLKQLTEHSPEGNDNETIVGDNTSTNYHSQRMTIMFQVPKQDEDADDDEAALSAITKMNQMIQTLVNKLPSVRVGPWTSTTSTI